MAYPTSEFTFGHSINLGKTDGGGGEGRRLEDKRRQHWLMSTTVVEDVHSKSPDTFNFTNSTDND